MLLQPTLNISEIFPSIQGEGLRQGEATLFCRLSGCNLKCSFCDTKYAWEEGKNCTISEILEKIKKIRRRFSARWVCLTGGEPLLQDIEELVRGLKAENFNVQIETNATLYRSLLVDWYTISPKPDKYFYQPEYRKVAREVKIVLTRELKFEIIQGLREEFPPEVPILLQPQSNKKWSIALGFKFLRKALKFDLDNIRLSFQLHTTWGLR